MDAKHMSLQYDRNADVCYLSYGEPRPSVCEEADDGVLVRIDPESGQVTGVTIVDFTRRCAGMPVRIPTEAPRRLPQASHDH